MMTHRNWFCVLLLLGVFNQCVTSYRMEKTYDSKSCIFIGCSCGINDIKCPASESDIRFTMFPKRSLYDMTSRNISLDLSNNNIKVIPDDRFAHMSFFKVNLSANRIEELSSYSFRDIDNLIILDLSSNFLEELNAHTFIYFEKMLKTIILERNNLFRLDKFHLSNALSKINKLENLNLAHNDLTNLPNLTRLGNLKILYFASNKLITLVDPLDYTCLLPVSITELHFQYNHLKTLNKYAFYRLKNLKYLNLAYNQISAISEQAFVYLTGLRELNLRNNYLKHIPSRIFYTLNVLDHLDLSSQKTHLERIDNFAFDRQSNLNAISSIDLSNNHISQIETRAFCSTTKEYFVNIKEINLRENNLKSINSCNMQQLANGYLEGFRVLIKTSKASRNITNQHHLLVCDCDLTRASKLVNLDGECVDSLQKVHASSLYNCHTYWRSRRQICSKEYDCKIKSSIITNKFTTSRITPTITTPFLTTTFFDTFDYLLQNETGMNYLSENLTDLVNKRNTTSQSGADTREAPSNCLFVTYFLLLLFLNNFNFDII